MRERKSKKPYTLDAQPRQIISSSKGYFSLAHHRRLILLGCEASNTGYMAWGGKKRKKNVCLISTYRSKTSCLSSGDFCFLDKLLQIVARRCVAAWEGKLFRALCVCGIWRWMGGELLPSFQIFSYWKYLPLITSASGRTAGAYHRDGHRRSKVSRIDTSSTYAYCSDLVCS